MFKVVVDATPLRPKPSGIGIYVYNLINNLASLEDRENFQLGVYYQPALRNWLKLNFSTPEILKQYSSVHLVPIPVTFTNLLSRYPNPIIPYFERNLGKPDIVHGTDYVVYPCEHSLQVMNIHDVTYIKYNNYTSSIVKTYIGRIQQSLKKTSLILTVSQSSKKDIIKYFDVDPNIVYVTPLASRYHGNYLSPEHCDNLEKEARYNFSQPYILFVSTIEPRKNINSIIDAFNFLKQKYKIPHHLVLIGKKGWNYQPIFAAIENSPWNQQIHHLDYLSDQLVALFYSKADVFVYPSHYEGFGLPVLEAMTLGAPVITANTSSLPEVAGNAALLINPNEPIELAEAILKVVSDSQLRQELVRKGRERAKLFSWERTARENLNAYRSIL